MKLYLITSDLFGIFFFKADNEDDALELFKVGMDFDSIEKYITNNRTLCVQEATMELLFRLLPMEGKITDDASL